MGFRFRKSLNLGGGFRINFSKSGIGYSWGVKGYRVTKTAKGTVRQTLSIPGTGISYVEEQSLKKQDKQGRLPNKEFTDDIISKMSFKLAFIIAITLAILITIISYFVDEGKQSHDVFQKLNSNQGTEFIAEKYHSKSL